MPLTNESFLRDFAQLSAIGATDKGGVERQAGTAADHATRDWLAGWLTAKGFSIRCDGIGNQFGLFEHIPGAPYVLIGSHLDSQPKGGKFDGAYGVFAAAFAAARITEKLTSGELTAKRNVAVVNWFNEEGCRFTPSMMGSGVFTGKLALDEALDTVDVAGVSVREAMTDVMASDGYTGPDVACYGEIHIEQGRLLENDGITIGLVDKTWGARKFLVTVHGEQSHTGATAMEDRKDALYGAAMMITAAREVVDSFTPGILHTAVSYLEVLPNSPVTVARETTFNMDLRSADETVLDEAIALLEKAAADAEAKARVRIVLDLKHRWGLLAYQPEGVALAESAADHLGLSHRTIMTLAGHDSTNMKDVVPSIMLFVPSADGISHNEREHTSDEDCVAGLELFTEVTRRMVAGDLA